jgi:hypothetical protein
MSYSIETPHGNYTGETLKDAQAAMRKGAKLAAKAQELSDINQRHADLMSKARGADLYRFYLAPHRIPRHWYREDPETLPSSADYHRIRIAGTELELYQRFIHYVIYDAGGNALAIAATEQGKDAPIQLVAFATYEGKNGTYLLDEIDAHVILDQIPIAKV